MPRVRRISALFLTASIALLAVPATSLAGSMVANTSADTFVDSAAATTSMGRADLVNVDYDSASSERIALLKFIVPAVPAGQQVANVKLRFYVTNPGGAGTFHHQHLDGVHDLEHSSRARGVAHRRSRRDRHRLAHVRPRHAADGWRYVRLRDHVHEQ